MASSPEPPIGLHGNRREAMRRLKIGVGGLLLMLLLVALASSIMQTARDTEEPGTPTAGEATESPEPANDPLVDIGVVPELPGEQQNQVVPDLPADQMPPEVQAGGQGSGSAQAGKQ